MIVKSPMSEQKRKQTNRRSSEKFKKVNGQPRSNGNGMAGAPHGPAKGEKEKSGFSLFSIAPWKIILTSFIIGGLGLLYLTHVFNTQQLLRDVQQLEQEYNKAKRLHEEYRLKYDRMIGPTEVHKKAKDMGFINGGPADQIIEVDTE